ncbi:large ribosomal subunit protein mL53-like [Dysidea avara]|uniref:large ribosomal subunit protein mL53-like n=1 Tax=Dysidea avara TaxID=196820 RepID=UPI00331E4333
MSFGKAARHARGLDLSRIKKVIVTFWSYDQRNSAVREIYRALSRDQLKESNPKCSITANVLSIPIDPKVEVTFADNSTILYNTVDMEAIQLLAKINKKAKSL